MRSTTWIRVRYADTDAAGIVHYAHYLAYLEAGRTEAFRAAGLESEQVVASCMHAPLIEAALRYRAPACFDDLLEVDTWVADVSGYQFRCAYEIRRAADQVLVATSQTLHEWIDPEVPGSAQPPGWLLIALERLRE